MIYQSEDLFLHDTAWKDNVISNFRRLIAQRILSDNYKNESLDQAQFFYSFCCEDNIQNHHYLLNLFMIFTNLEHQIQQNISEQPFVIFFDQYLNRSDYIDIKKLIWNALNSIQQSNASISAIQRSKNYNQSDDYYFYFNGTPLLIHYIDDDEQLILVIQKILPYEYNQKQMMQKVS